MAADSAPSWLLAECRNGEVQKLLSVRGAKEGVTGLTIFWMTSLRPGHSPPQVTTAAVTCSHRIFFQSAFSQVPKACQLYYPSPPVISQKGADMEKNHAAVLPESSTNFNLSS